MGRFVVGGPLYWLGWLSTGAMVLSVVAMGAVFFGGATLHLFLRGRKAPSRRMGGASWFDC